jgi:hypothetical protein
MRPVQLKRDTNLQKVLPHLFTPGREAGAASFFDDSVALVERDIKNAR